MAKYQITVSFEAEDDSDAIAVMEYLDGDLPESGVPATDVSTSMPRRHVPERWERVPFPPTEVEC